MDPIRPAFVPDASLSHGAMAALQRDIADAATFADVLEFDPGAVTATPEQAGDGTDSSETPPLVAGVDQTFLPDDRAVSAVVVSRGGEVVERVHAVVDTEIPYIPGLLAFREGGASLAAFERLECDPDVALIDGSGRIHYREAGLATHLGVTLDLPTVGVAKRLLCGTPARPLEETFPVGTRVPIEADDAVETATDGTVIGYAVQTRQFDSPDRHVNPLYVSPGHRVSAATAANLVESTCAGYKLPEPTRRADAYADEAKAAVEG